VVSAPGATEPTIIDQLAAGVPKKKGGPTSITRLRPDVGGICRAQPARRDRTRFGRCADPAAAPEGAYLGARVPIFDDAIQVRDRHRASDLTEPLGQSPAVIMRRNGALTIGNTIGEAVARMWIREASARMNHVDPTAGTLPPFAR
jgi:hypothetical protein